MTTMRPATHSRFQNETLRALSLPSSEVDRASQVARVAEELKVFLASGNQYLSESLQRAGVPTSLLQRFEEERASATRSTFRSEVRDYLLGRVQGHTGTLQDFSVFIPVVEGITASTSAPSTSAGAHAIDQLSEMAQAFAQIWSYTLSTSNNRHEQELAVRILSALARHTERDLQHVAAIARDSLSGISRPLTPD